MNFRLRSKHITFETIHPGGFWGINPTHQPFPWMRSAPISLAWHDNQNRHIWLADRAPTIVSDIEDVSMLQGDSQLITFEWEPKSGSVSKKLEYSLIKNQPVLLWRFQVDNQSRNPVYLDRITLMHTGAIGSKSLRISRPWAGSTPEQNEEILGLGFAEKAPDLAFYTNGWQSWNYAGTLGFNDPFPWSRFGPLSIPMRVNAGTPKPKRKGHFISNFFGVLGDRKSQVGFILGLLSERQAFGIIEAWVDPENPTLRMWADLDGVRVDPNQSLSTDWAYCEVVNLKDEDPLVGYFEAVALENNARRNQQVRTGWCSWYHAFESVSERFMMNNLEWASSNRTRLPLEIIQLDDGYETEVGDWFAWKKTFPSGLEGLSSTIQEADFMPGLWLAPFVAKRRSEIVRRRPEWILRNRFRLPANPGFLWDSFPYVLDVTHPGVMDHLRDLMMEFTQEMGYEYLKLDFLYAGALPGVRYNPTLTRAQGLHQALQNMREAAGDDVELLGCGCPLGSGIGIFDVMRIGPDVAPRWKPSHWGMEVLLDTEKGMPSARNAILTTINRLPMHQRWWINDPDCLLIRSTDTYLSEAEVQTLASVIAMSGGALIISDDLPSLIEERVNWLARLIPPTPHTARAVDWFDTPSPSKLVMDIDGAIGSWKLIALINWADQSSDLILNLLDFGLESSSNYHILDFWNEQYYPLSKVELLFKNVPPHGVRMLSIRRASPEPQWLGDTLHFSQGLILTNWQLQPNHLVAQIDLPRKASGKAWIELSETPRAFRLDDREIEGDQIAPGVFQLILNIDGKAHFQVLW